VTTRPLVAASMGRSPASTASSTARPCGLRGATECGGHSGRQGAWIDWVWRYTMGKQCDALGDDVQQVDLVARAVGPGR